MHLSCPALKKKVWFYYSYLDLSNSQFVISNSLHWTGIFKHTLNWDLKHTNETNGNLGCSNKHFPELEIIETVASSCGVSWYFTVQNLEGQKKLIYTRSDDLSVQASSVLSNWSDFPLPITWNLMVLNWIYWGLNLGNSTNKACALQWTEWPFCSSLFKKYPMHTPAALTQQSWSKWFDVQVVTDPDLLDWRT